MQQGAASFAGKKITLMGLGLLGRGLGDAKFLAKAGASLIITDLKTEEDLAPSVASLAGFPNITFHLGGHQLEDFENRDLIIKAPNTPLDSPFIAHARERGIPIEMDAALFVKLSAALFGAAGPVIVGVTGTRGKSTVTHLIYEMTRTAFVRNVYLGGNVKDTATLPLLEIIQPNDVVILELDSWQLQGFEEDRISPHLAVWTNFMPDHMNYYHGDVDRYFSDKAAIARFQKPGDLFVAPRDIKEKIETRFGRPTGTWIAPQTISEHPADGWDIALIGAHNRANAALAVAAARALNIPDEIIKTVLKDFHGLPNRLERLGEKNGVAFYNDSNATTPEAAVAALRALGETPATKNRPIILIAGGNDKELDFSPLAEELAKDEKKIKKIILFNGKASEKIIQALPKKLLPPTMATTMQEAFTMAVAAAVPGDLILLSPAATSFGIFKNEYDRGEQFRECYASWAR
jgi:UDP-N-acetylmuramoylalanine--D-glutamate ligase